MIVVRFVLLFLSWEMLSNAAAEAPRYPTQLQEAVFASGSAVAREKSGAAVPIVEKMLEAVKNQTSVANWTASDVLDRLVAELKVAELVTNFVASSVLVDNKTWIDSLFELDRYPGAWEVSLRDNDENAYEGCDNYGLEFMNDAETEIYGFPQFATYCRPTPSEAYERPVYVALNIFKVDVGNSDFGDVSLVVKRDFSLNNTLVAAIDTGFWEQKCNRSLPAAAAEATDYCIPDELGTLEDFVHLLSATSKFYDGEDWLARLVNRTIGDDAWGSSKVGQRRIIEYWESNPLRSFYFDQAVRFVIATFSSLFGTRDGDRLRDWCARTSRILVWGLGDPFLSQPNFGPPPPHPYVTSSSLSLKEEIAARRRHAFLDGRLLDPVVLAALGDRVVDPHLLDAVATPQALLNTMKYWNQSLTLRQRPPVTVASAQKEEQQQRHRLQWFDLYWDFAASLPSQARIQPLTATSPCASSHQRRNACIGTVYDDQDTCVCYVFEDPQ